MKINRDLIESVQINSKIKSNRWKYRRDIYWKFLWLFPIKMSKAGYHYSFSPEIWSESEMVLHDPTIYVEGVDNPMTNEIPIVYQKPHIVIRHASGKTITNFFDTIEELDNYVTENIRLHESNWIDVK